MGSGASRLPSYESIFEKGDRVEFRDKRNERCYGTVTQVKPVKVRPDGWDKSFTWGELLKIKGSSDDSFSKGDRVWVRDNGTASGKRWLLGTVTQGYPLMVQPDGWNSSHQWNQVITKEQEEAAEYRACLAAAGGNQELAAVIYRRRQVVVTIGTEVEVRDNGEDDWHRGRVTEMGPIKVKVPWKSEACEWDHVRPYVAPGRPLR